MTNLVIGGVLLAIGCLLSLTAVLGVFEFKFVINRMHAAAIVDAGALLFILAGLMVISADMNYIPKLLLVLAFQWIGSPIASHMVARLEVEVDKSAEKHMDQERV